MGPRFRARNRCRRLKQKNVDVGFFGALVLSLLISLTLTPMMCSRLLKPESNEHGRFYRLFERGFDGLLAVYEKGLKIVLRYRFITLMTLFVTIGLTGYLYYVIPKGFFPEQDTGLIIGLSEAAQDISYQAMAEREQAPLNAIMKDPSVDSIGSAIGAGGGTTTINNGRVFIALKAHDQRPPINQVIARLRKNLARIQGITLYMQAAQDITIGGRISKTMYQYTLDDADPGELNHWAGIFLKRIQRIPGIVDVTSDQLNAGPLLDVTIKREVTSTYGILPYAIDNTLDDAFGQRIVSTMYTTLNQYHVVLEVDPKFQFGPEALNNIYVPSSSGQQVPLATLVDSAVKVEPLAVNHQGQFPSVTISFNLQPGTAIGTAVAAIQNAEKELGKPLSLQTSFQGNAQAFGDALSSMTILIFAARCSSSTSCNCTKAWCTRSFGPAEFIIEYVRVFAGPTAQYGCQPLLACATSPSMASSRGEPSHCLIEGKASCRRQTRPRTETPSRSWSPSGNPSVFRESGNLAPRQV